MPEQLGPGSAHLWLCSLEAASALDASVLSAEEAARRPEAALGRVWQRHLLSHYAATSPADWQFETGRHGKPRLTPVQPLEFNLSHSGDWLVMVVAEGVPVGVDIQQWDSQRRLDRLARRYFSGPEVELLSSLDGDAQLRHFYRLWTLKEAWTKAHGGALPTALGEVGYRLEGEALVCLAPGAGEHSSQWLAELDGYSLAFCGLQRGIALQSREWLSPARFRPCELAAVAGDGLRQG